MVKIRSSMEVYSRTGCSGARLRKALEDAKRMVIRETQERKVLEVQLAKAVANEVEARRKTHAGDVGAAADKAKGGSMTLWQAELLDILDVSPESASSMVQNLRDLPPAQ